MDETKQCTCCRQQKPLEAFSVRCADDDQRQSRCKRCVAQTNAVRYWRTHPQRRRLAKMSSQQRAEAKEHGMMVCGRCGVKKALTEFRVVRTNGREYFRRQCDACERKRQAEWRRNNPQRLWQQAIRYKCPRYGITSERYLRMLAEQNNACAICGRPLSQKGQTLDHDHRTGAVRGIVHSQCNLMIGNAGDDVDVLRRGIEYLKRHGCVRNSFEPSADTARSDVA